MQATVNTTLIGATYAARTTELIYRHLRGKLESDDDINEFIADLMEETPSRALEKHPSIPIGASSVDITLRVNPVHPNPLTSQPISRLTTPPPPPPPQLSLIQHIEGTFRTLKALEHERYLQHINTRLDQSPPPHGDRGYQDPDLLRVEGWLSDYVGVAEEFLELKLSDRT